MKNLIEVIGPETWIFLERKRDNLRLKTVIDTADLPLVLDFIGSNTWSILDSNIPGKYYAYTGIKSKRSGLLHRVIMGWPDKLTVDHINRDRLDNRRANLRNVTLKENCNNCIPKRPCGKGYGFDKMTGKWRVRVRCKGYKKTLYFTREDDARVAVDQLRSEFLLRYPRETSVGEL
jgi:hypothetical protein